MKNKLTQSIQLLLFINLLCFSSQVLSQAIRIPQNQNLRTRAGRTVGVTAIDISWNAPSVRGREGNIWGTSVVPFGFTVLGFGSNVESPWRAGADECTTMSFSTDVTINGQPLAAGKYAFFIAVYADSCVLIFNKNTSAWGSYFYDKSQDVLRVPTIQAKYQASSQELLTYTFDKQTNEGVEVALVWEKWKISFAVGVDTKKTVLADIKRQMSGALGFDPPSLATAANWCLQNNVNLEEALNWANSAVNPNLGGLKTFFALSTQSALLEKLGKKAEADETMKSALENASVIEMHQYGRQLLSQKKAKEAMAVFEQNYKKHNGAWPTNVGMMRGYSATGNLKKALEHAKAALLQAPDDINKKSLSDAIKKLEEGKTL